MALGIAYRPELYLGESINRKKLDKIKKKLENRPLFSGVFLIAFSRNPLALVEKIVKECLTVRGDCALKEYLQC